MPTGTGLREEVVVPLFAVGWTGVVDADEPAMTSVNVTATATNTATTRAGEAVALSVDAHARPIRRGRSAFILVIAATGPVKYGTLTRSLPWMSVGSGFVSFKRCLRHPTPGESKPHMGVDNGGRSSLQREKPGPQRLSGALAETALPGHSSQADSRLHSSRRWVVSSRR